MRIALNESQWSLLSGRIDRYCGVALDASRVRSVEDAVALRLDASGQPDIDLYLRRLDARELQTLVELIVNHETQFFRTPAHYRVLNEHILPELHQARPTGLPIRCWSAGCSTGEEAYSLAMTALKTLPRGRDVMVYATDLSGAALARAREGRYRGRTLSNLALADRERFFRPADDALEIAPEVAALVHFEQHNLQNALPPWAHVLDIILCQNVTIYFSLETCRSLMSRLFDALQPGGYLVVGYSETLWRIFDRFETVEFAGAFVYRKPQLPRGSEVPSSSRPTSVELRPRSARRRVLANQPTITDEARVQEARALLTAGQLAAALDVLHRVPLHHPQYPEVLALIARVHANRGDWEQAAVEARRAIDLNLLTGEAHLLVGIVCARQERWGAATEHLLRAQYLDPLGPLPSFYLADVYRNEGRVELAEREYRMTQRKLEALPSTMLLDGVPVALLRETCSRYLDQLGPTVRRR